MTRRLSACQQRLLGGLQCRYLTIHFVGALMSDYAILQDDTCSEPGAGIPGDPNIPSNYVSILSTERKISIFLSSRPAACRCMTGSILVCSSSAETQRCANRLHAPHAHIT